MRFAYADPPYPGQSRALYADHPDYAGEVDYAALVERLEDEYPDGWALSTSAQALPYVLSLCPCQVRVAAWYKTNAPPIRITRGWIWSWEPIIVCGGRPGRDPVRDALAAGIPNGSIPGQKPDAFSRWMLNLLGAEQGDRIDDLFPGSGAVSRLLASWSSQGVLYSGPREGWDETLLAQTLDGSEAKRKRRYRAGTGDMHRGI